MTKGQKWPHILCLTLGMWIPAMALCRVPRAPAGGSPCPWDVSSSDTCFSFSKHDIRQGFNYASCPNLLSCHYKGLQWVLSLGLLKGKESISQRLRNYLLRDSKNFKSILDIHCHSYGSPKGYFFSKLRGRHDKDFLHHPAQNLCFCKNDIGVFFGWKRIEIKPLRCNSICLLWETKLN